MHALPPHTIQNTFGSLPQCTMCMSARLANYPCVEKDKGQSKVTMGGGELGSTYMASVQIISNMLGIFFIFFIVFHYQCPGDRWYIGFKEGNRILHWRKTLRQTLLLFSCWVSVRGSWQVATDWWCMEERLGFDNIQSAHLFSWLQDSAIVYGL